MYDGTGIYIAWHDFLLKILKSWNADIQMDLHDHVVIYSFLLPYSSLIVYFRSDC